MKRLMFLAFLFGFWYLAWNAPLRSFGPELLEAQGCGLRVDTPRGRIDCFDSGGRWSNDPRRFDPHFNGMYGYGGYAPDTMYNQGGIILRNMPPGTTLKVEKEGGGLFCSWLFSFLGCSKEKVEFSTAPAAGQQTQTKPQAQVAPYESAAPAPPIKEEPLPQ